MTGNVVKDFMLGETRIRICDDCCRDKTPEDVDKILKQIAKDVLPSLRAKHVKDLEKAKANGKAE